MTVHDVIDLPTDLAEADRLISDLAALLDAGLVAVQENRLGPARYGVVARLDAEPDPPRAPRHGGIPLRGGYRPRLT